MNVDKLQGEYLDILDEVIIEELQEYSLKQLLFNQTYYVLTKKRCEVLYTIISSFFFKRALLEDNICQSDILFFSERYVRQNYAVYWNQIINLFTKKDIIYFNNLQLKKFYRYFDLISLPRKINKFFKFTHCLKKINNVVHRGYLAAQLVWLYELHIQLLKLDISPKVAMCFFDSGFHENMLVQYLKNRGVTTITNQHGQPLFRSWKFDRMNQSQILNFKSDYFIAKGEFTKQQFVKAGYDEKSIIVLGGFEPESRENENDEEKKCFGIFLDCPYLPFAEKTNVQLLKIAKNISKEMQYKYVVKIHPTDKEERYNSLINSQGKILKSNIALSEVFPNIDFGILSASAVYLDMLINKVKSYKMVSDIEYPLVQEELEQFHGENEFYEKYECWKNLTQIEKNNYLKKIRELYYEFDNFESKLIKFVYEQCNK